jgi:hypothetical protein
MKARQNILGYLRKINKKCVKDGRYKKKISAMDIVWHQLVELEPPSITQKNKKRLIVILNSRGCSYAIGGEGPCFNCGLVTASSQGREVSYKNTIKQFDKILNHYNFNDLNIVELDLFNAGSLLDDWQIGAAARESLFAKIATIDRIKDILIDSRPEDVTEDKILRIKKIIKNKQLWVGIGLETSNDRIRNLCINKNFSLKNFEKAVKILNKYKVNLFAYLIFKPAFLTEYEAIKNAKDTIKYLSSFSKMLSIPLRISLEPGVVQGDCLLTKLYSEGFYNTPWLWSIIKVIKETYKYANGCLRVGIPEEIPKIIDRRRNYSKTEKTCRCSSLVEKHISNYNQKRTIDIFDFLPKCDCQKRWKAFLTKERIESQIPLEKRINLIIQSL